MVSGARPNIAELRWEIWQAHCSGRDAYYHVFVKQGVCVSDFVFVFVEQSADVYV